MYSPTDTHNSMGIARGEGVGGEGVRQRGDKWGQKETWLWAVGVPRRVQVMSD